MPAHDATRDVTAAASAVWKGFAPAPGTPEGFDAPHDLPDRSRRGGGDARALGAGH